MKKVLAGLVAVSAVALMLVGCGIDNPLDTDTVDITLALSASTVAAGQSLTATGTVDGSSEPTITYSIEAVSAGNADGVSYSATAVSGKNKVNLATDAALTVTTTAAACNGTYNLIVKGVVGATEVTKTVEFTVTGGVDCGALVEKSGTIANVFGPDTGAFDLVNGDRIPSSGSATLKDLKDMSLVGVGFAGELGSANGTTFATATAADYTNATPASVAALAANASAATVTIALNTVFVAKLGNSRGYAIVKITRYAPTAGASTTNKGEADFVYKFTL